MNQLSFGIGVLEINPESISPNPLEPGNDVLVQLNIINSGDEEVKISNINIDLKNNFILKSSSIPKDSTLCSNCKKTITYYLKVKDNLKSGLYLVEVKAEYNGNYETKKEIFIDVRGEPNLVISTKINGEIYPGSKFEILFNISNFGLSNAKRVKIIPNLDYIGFLNENLLYVDEIEKSNSKEIKGIIKSNENIETGYFQIPFLIEYQDEQNNKFQLIEKVGINILDKANLIVQDIKVPKKIIEGENFELSLKVQNDGFGKAKNVQVFLEGNIEGEKKGFLGTIKKDEDLLHFFQIKPTETGISDINISIKYTDDFGEHTTKENYKIEVNKNYNLYKYIAIIIGSLLFIILIISFFKRGDD